MIDYRGKFNGTGIMPADILIPKRQFLGKWPVVACDQYTSEPEYWNKTRWIVGDDPSTLNLVLPEAYLELDKTKPDGISEHTRGMISAIHECMDSYLTSGLFDKSIQGFVLTIRTFTQSQDKEKSPRIGLLVSVDLERYEYASGSESLIRPTEGTVVDRLPPRVAIRRGSRKISVRLRLRALRK